MTDNKEDDFDDFDFGNDVTSNFEEILEAETNDFDFDFCDDESDVSSEFDFEHKSVISNTANTINEKEVEKRAIAQAAFLAAREAEKKRIEDRLYLELRIVVETVKEYCEENDRIDWLKYILPTFTTLNKYGNRRNTEIMHALGNLITDITYKHEDDLHQVMPSKDALYIKLFASFIIDIAAGKL